MKVTYLSVAETAKLIRAALKQRFPGVKFSVRSSSYSMGCSVDVRWTDGPLSKDVEAVAGAFQGKRFDGSIDLGYTAQLWLLPDGTATVASDPGSVGSGGCHEPVREWMPHPDAKLICTGAWVHCTREVSDGLKERVASWLSRRNWEMFRDRHWQDERDVLHAVMHRAVVVDGALVVRKREVV